MDTGFVYRWTNIKNNMFYIGSHKGNVNDSYIGGGVYFKRAYKKNKSLFKRDILYQGTEFREIEDFILKSIDAENNNMMYNLKNSAIGGKTKLTEEGRKRLSKSKKGILNPNFGKSTWNKGLKRKPHVIDAIIKAQTGRKHTRESVIKRSKYLIQIDKKELMTIREAATFLGYKDCSTLREHINNKHRNKKLSKLTINKIKI